jgi:hypothetical protein
MQLRARIAALAALAAIAVTTPSAAGICVLTLDTAGTLKLSGDGYRLGSQEAGGISGIVLIGSIGASTVTVSAPTLTQWPAGYNPAGLALEVAYRGTGVISSVNQGYTTGQTNFNVPNLINTVALTLDNRAVTATGFAAGTYQTRTVVTCS